MISEEFEPIIGLEIHVELKTNSKMFCGCPADWFGKPPNSVCCPVCLGLPGALPVPNRIAVEWCMKLGLALNCEIPHFSKFDRKNYFYPDLPKGYQISQYDQPFAVNGWLEINNPITQSQSKADPPLAESNNPINKLSNQQINKSSNQQINSTMKQFVNKTMEKKIRIRRVHLEEDTGKLIHATVNGKKCTLIDFNRSGVPLVEIVTEPDIRSSEEARIFLKKLYQIIKYLGISDADMEKGSMRLEPNISVKRLASSVQIKDKIKSNYISTGIATSPSAPRNDAYEKLPPYKVEVKNINSFSFAKKAIDYEIDRQIIVLNRGEIPKQETRGWDEKKGITYSQRSKEEAQDYRYFPEPDIPPIRWSKDQIFKIKNQIGELPDQKIEKFMKEFGLSEYDATVLADEKETAEYFEKAINIKHITYNKEQITPKSIANWIINKKIDINNKSPEELIKLLQQKTQVIKADERQQQAAAEKVIMDNQKAVSDYQAGKTTVLMFLVGQVMRELKGRGDARTIRKILESKLK